MALTGREQLLWEALLEAFANNTFCTRETLQSSIPTITLSESALTQHIGRLRFKVAEWGYDICAVRGTEGSGVDGYIVVAIAANGPE